MGPEADGFRGSDRAGQEPDHPQSHPQIVGYGCIVGALLLGIEPKGHSKRVVIRLSSVGLTLKEGASSPAIEAASAR